MTPQRIWSDPTAETEFWRLMAAYEALQPQTVPERGVRALLTLSPLRRRAALRRLDAIRLEAEELVRRHTTPLDAVEPSAPEAGEEADRLHPALRIAATLANGKPARSPARSSGHSSGQASG